MPQASNPCEKCGRPFSVKRRRVESARFCSWQCRGHASPPGSRIPRRNAGCFVKGERRSPATQFRAGEHRSPATEFKRGHRGTRTSDIGTERVHKDRSGVLRVYVKTAAPNVWTPRAVIVWERAHGPLPPGKLVHHRDRNALNDAPGNLQALTRAEHIRVHHAELAAAKRAAREQLPLALGAE